ncbi:MAG: hypothetical protein JWQ60_2437, partial [Pseudonocardia sp.]|nr:hypothetical protein [Pseudonocardia sp.]
MTPAPPRHDGERSPNGLAVGGLEALPGARPVDTSGRGQGSDSGTTAGTPLGAAGTPVRYARESMGAAQRRR